LTALPIDRSADGASLLHVAFGIRLSKLRIGKIRYKAKPESFNAPGFADTGEFPAKRATYLMGELGLRRGPLWLMSEGLYNMAESPETGDPRFYAFTAHSSWTLTGEPRGYVRDQGVFLPVVPDRSVFKGGWGTWQIGAR